LTRFPAIVLIAVGSGLGCGCQDARVEAGYDDFVARIVDVVLTDGSAAIVMLESDGRTVPISVDLRTRIQVAGMTVPLSKLPSYVGDEVRVICETRDGKRGEAWVVEIQPRPARKPVRSG
jgi:hypothetical protein